MSRKWIKISAWSPAAWAALGCRWLTVAVWCVLPMTTRKPKPEPAQKSAARRGGANCTRSRGWGFRSARGLALDLSGVRVLAAVKVRKYLILARLEHCISMEAAGRLQRRVEVSADNRQPSLYIVRDKSAS